MLRVTFLLTGDNRSGGVRVTMLMGNLLSESGYTIRIIYPKKRWTLTETIRKIRNIFVFKQKNAGWLNLFKGNVEVYRDINNILFEKGEIVIGVGTYMISELIKIKADVRKVRYNHGFPHEFSNEQKRMWSLPITTITVSETLVPELEKLSGQKVAAVIPNGISLEEYHPIENVSRDGIGTIYSVHPNKAPKDILSLLNAVDKRFPAITKRVFGTTPNPLRISNYEYFQLPAINKVREIYNRSKVWLLASYTEGFPGPVLEAMACGCIVISTDNDGSLEIIENGTNGIIVPKGDIDAFIRAITRVFQDNEFASNLQKNGYTTAAKYSWKSSVEKMNTFLNNLV